MQNNKFSRLRMGLDLIQMDLKNARSRQRARLKRNGVYSLGLNNDFDRISAIINNLKWWIRKVEKLEVAEKVNSKRRRNEGGQNMNLGGTYGKI